MNFLGIGGLELIVVFLIALFVVGPTRLVHGARTARKFMTELRRQREELTQMVEEAVDMEDIRERLDQSGVMDEVRDLSQELNSFQEDARSLTTDAADFKSLAHSVVRPGGYTKSNASTPAESTSNAPDKPNQDSASKSETETPRTPPSSS